MKSDANIISRNKPLQQYAADVLSETLVTGVPNIVNTPNWPRKIFKLTVLLLCITGFLYQTIEFLKLVYSYPSNVDISVYTPEKYLFPAIDVCNNNGIMRSKFCVKYPERCETPENKTEFCAANSYYSQYCKDEAQWEKFKVPKSEFYGYAENTSLRDLKEVTQEEKSLFKLTKVLVIPEDLDLDVTGPHIIFKNSKQFIPCYTIHFRAISAEDPIKLPTIPLSSIVPTIILTVDFERSETFIPGRKPEGILVIHSPFEFINPVQYGIRIKPDKLYNVHMTMVEEELLPLPYESDCMNYTEEWLTKGRKGPRSQQMCRVTCLYDTFIKNCNCSNTGLAYPYDDDTCLMDSEECLRGPAVSDLLKCLPLCKDDCEKKKFSHTVDERVIEDFDWETEEDKERHRAYVFIHFSDPEVVVYKHRPRYEVVEVFSYIGGYIGMWLGISLVAVVDFMECLFLIATFAFRRRK